MPSSEDFLSYTAIRLQLLPVDSNLHIMQLAPTTPKSVAAAALGQDVGLWIDKHRNGPAQLSYRQISQILAAETGVQVTREALRQWHVEYTNRAA